MYRALIMTSAMTLSVLTETFGQTAPQVAAHRHGAEAATPTEIIRDAALAFLDSLGPELRAQATFDMEDPERKRWSVTKST